MKIHRMQQRTPEWFQIRLGKITGTSFTTMANGRKDTKEALCLKTATEIVTGVPCESQYTNEAMESGIELEATARAVYEVERLCHVEQVGFIEHESGWVGISPDGLTGEGGIEIKCPQPHTHLGYLLDPDKAWRSYKWQIQGALWLTGRKWWDFVSYCPVFPQEKQLLIVRVEPDDADESRLAAGALFSVANIKRILEQAQ